MRTLRFTNVEVERVRLDVAHHMRPQQLADAKEGVTRRAAIVFFRDVGEAGVDVLLLALADHIATHGPDVQTERWGRRIKGDGELLAEYWARLAENVEPPPLVSGHDLMNDWACRPASASGNCSKRSVKRRRRARLQHARMRWRWPGD